MKKKSGWHIQLDQRVDDLAAEMMRIRQHLHAHPEPSGDEQKTASYIAQQLQQAGLEPQLVAGDRGVLVDSNDSRSSGSNQRIAIRGDIDALRIQDTKQANYSSKVPGIMHACGHDAHTAITWGTAVALSKAMADEILPWDVGWRGIFQPAEEINTGALEMMEAGALEDVDAILTLHVDPSRPVGMVGMKQGAFTANCVTLELIVSGRGGHAARPHQSCDPIAAVAQLISSIYQFIPRRFDAQESVVISFGEIKGGENSNVIPDRVVVRGTLRTHNPKITEATLVHIQRLAKGIADASETRIELRTTFGPPGVHNDAALTTLLESSARDLLGSDHVQSIVHASMGGEDFANYLTRVPGAMFRLGTASDSIQPTTLHAPDFDIDEGALAIGAKILARTVVQWNKPD